MVSIEPASESGVRFSHLDHPPCVCDRRLHLHSVSDDAGVLQQQLNILLTKAGYSVDIKISKRPTKPSPLVKNRLPREPRLVYLQNEALEQYALVTRGEAVFGVVIDPMNLFRVWTQNISAVGCGGSGGG